MRPRHPKLADKHFCIGEEYTLVEEEQRSMASHGHYFASISECWRSLPEAGAERFPTSESLRKYALIKAGYRDERSIACASKDEARRLAAFIKPMDDFAVVIVSDATVTVYTAKSQAMRAMGKKVFAESKDAVLRVLSEMLGVDVGQIPQREAA
jgi:hypothetical protein